MTAQPARNITPAVPTRAELADLAARLEVPPLRVDDREGVRIVRDDLLLGGSKARALPRLMAASPGEWVYAGPTQGYAQLALAIGGLCSGQPATLFVAARKHRAPLTLAAAALGCQVYEVPAGRLSVLTARARQYCELTGARRAPIGLRLPGYHEALVHVAQQLEAPDEAWVAVGSGSLAAALADAWPSCQVNGVQIGMEPHVRHPAVRYWRAPEAFEHDATGPLPPVPSAQNYDAKVWRFVAEHAQPGALWWNVAGTPPTPSEAWAALRRGSLLLPERAA